MPPPCGVEFSRLLLLSKMSSLLGRSAQSDIAGSV